MSDGQDDEIPEIPGDGFEKHRYFLELSLERAKSQASAPGSAISKVADAVRKAAEELGEPRVSLLSASLLERCKPSPFMEAVSKANDALKARFERNDQLKRKWREEWEAGQVEAPSSVPGDPAPQVAVVPRRKPAVSPEGIEQLRQHREKLLAAYMAATGHSKQFIYKKGTAEKLHTCYKQKFHLWQRGELPADAAPSVSLERLLTSLEPIADRKPKKKLK